MLYNVWEEFYIIWDNNKIEKYNICGFYTHTRKNEETQEKEEKSYYVYQKYNELKDEYIVMTIWENFMYKTLEEVKTKIYEMLDKNILDNENLRKEILEFNI